MKAFSLYEELRCYVRRERRGHYLAHCVDWDLWASGTTQIEAIVSLRHAVVGYAETIAKVGEDVRQSIPLFVRRAPLRHRILYGLCWFIQGGRGEQW